jgi:hypothetical protein
LTLWVKTFSKLAWEFAERRFCYRLQKMEIDAVRESHW